MTPRPRRGKAPLRIPLLFALAVFLSGGRAHAQQLPAPDRAAYIAMDGAELYQTACAGCHGADGRGEPSLSLFLADPPVPDFTGCSFASREPDADWIAVAHDGGPVRGFSPMMPAFGGMLEPDDLQRVMDYIRTLCDDSSWPRGELNLPRAMFTEKAYPEDELVWTTDVPLGDGGSAVTNEIVYEKRFGAQSQIEVVVPFGLREREGGSWVGGLGDLVLGVKHTLFHSLDAGSILSLGGEVKFPTGREEDGFGDGTTVFESFLSYGQILPSDAFVQLQGVAEFPTESGHDNELVGRSVIGWSHAEGGWNRTWTPMLEVQAKRELADGEAWRWDVVPQLQVTLNTRQHVVANVAVLLPLTERESRDPRLTFYILWDWFDGSILDGW